MAATGTNSLKTADLKLENRQTPKNVSEITLHMAKNGTSIFFLLGLTKISIFARQF